MVRVTFRKSAGGGEHLLAVLRKDSSHQLSKYINKLLILQSYTISSNSMSFKSFVGMFHNNILGYDVCNNVPLDHTVWQELET